LSDNTLDDGNGNMGEAYESIWVKTAMTEVVEEFPLYDNWLISDTGARDDSLEVDPFATLTYVPTLGHQRIIEGFMDFYYVRQIVPLSDEYIFAPPVGVWDSTPSVTARGGFTKVSPNPFNPKTDIQFVTTRVDMVQLNIYNIRGHLVTSLVSGQLPAAEHKFVWDGTDSFGQDVSSGTYFARLRIGTDVLQVHKLALIK
ncbi:MAG: FlgD immunoglobulin-like domain containing protein, partial [bacterium]